MDWNRLIQMILGMSRETRRVVLCTIFVSLAVPVWTIISSFGDRALFQNNTRMQLWIPLLIGILLVAFLYRIHVRYVPALLMILLPGTILITLTGANPTMRYVGPIVGMVYAEGATILLAIAAWTGTFVGYGTIALAPGGTQTPEVFKEARENFQSFCVFAFWFGLISFVVGVTADIVPTKLTLTALAAVILIVPAALSLLGRTAFTVMYRLTIAGLVACVLMGIVLGLEKADLISPFKVKDVLDSAAAINENLQYWFWVVGLAIMFSALLAKTISRPGIFGIAFWSLAGLTSMFGVNWFFWRNGLTNIQEAVNEGALILPSITLKVPGDVNWYFVSFWVLAAYLVLATLVSGFTNKPVIRRTAFWVVVILGSALLTNYYIWK